MHLIPHYSLALICDIACEKPTELDTQIYFNKRVTKEWARNLEFRELRKNKFQLIVRSDQLHRVLIYAMQNFSALYRILEKVQNKQMVLNLILANLYLDFNWAMLSRCCDLNLIKQNMFYQDTPVPWNWHTITRQMFTSNINVIFEHSTIPWDWDMLSALVSFNTFISNLRFSDGSIVPWNRAVLRVNREFMRNFANSQFDQFYDKLL